MSAAKPTASTRPLDLRRGRVEMIHGNGGRAMTQLVEQLFVPAFDNVWLDERNDQARFELPPGRVVMATDTHVVTPLFFPGGDIGSLAVHGTINDVVMSGGVPAYLSAGFVIEEGFALADLEQIVFSMAAASRAAGVPIITGDTKVVERGKGDGVFINTTGVGTVGDGIDISAAHARSGDHIIVSGPIGDHGIAVMAERENLGFETALLSDSAPLHELVANIIAATDDVHCLRDPTRGGVAAALNEIAQQSGCGMLIREADIPVRAEVRAACELLGLDPLYVACEGRLLAICPPAAAEAVLNALQKQPLGRDAAAIGIIRDEAPGFVEMETAFGGRRIVDWLAGDQLPRIC